MTAAPIPPREATRRVSDEQVANYLRDPIKWDRNHSFSAMRERCTVTTADLRDSRACEADLTRERDRIIKGAAKTNEEVCQALGRALNYPRLVDDQKNFPGATDADGVCVGDHIAETLANEVESKIADLTRRLAEAERREREAWCAGRDAAAVFVRDQQSALGSVMLAEAIMNLNPPKPEGDRG